MAITTPTNGQGKVADQTLPPGLRASCFGWFVRDRSRSEALRDSPDCSLRVIESRATQLAAEWLPPPRSPGLPGSREPSVEPRLLYAASRRAISPS